MKISSQLNSLNFLKSTWFEANFFNRDFTEVDTKKLRYGKIKKKYVAY